MFFLSPFHLENTNACGQTEKQNEIKKKKKKLRLNVFLSIDNQNE